MKVTLVRHGQTFANTEKRFAGWTDTKLTDLGKSQGLDTSGRLNMADYDVFVASDLSRAIDTLTLIMGTWTKGIETLESFREMHFGQWENMTLEEIKATGKDQVDQWWQDYAYYKTPQGESLNDMYIRVNEAFDLLLKNNKGKNILLVTHSGVMRAILSKLICETVEGYWKFKIENCAIVELEFVDGFPVIQFV